MKKVKIAFDIDGTLRCNCTPTCGGERPRIGKLLEILGSFKNVELHAWSGGGKDYAYQFIKDRGFDGYIPESRCHSKLLAHELDIDIAIDDQHDFNLAKFNLIVREK